MKYLKKYWFIFLVAIGLSIVIIKVFYSSKKDKEYNLKDKNELITGTVKIPNSINDSLILYGKKLIDSTSRYLGPHGIVASITNGLDCENCHLESGTKLFTNNFLAVASTYPKFRERSGKLESVEWRINECLQRSLNGEMLDSSSKEMKAMVAYIKWTGKNIPGVKADAGKVSNLPYLERPADTAKGRIVYSAKCKLCHGENGKGIIAGDSLKYIYPPLWGDHSYAVSAGMYRITKLASFIKYNMPLGATFEKPQLTDSEAWDIAAYINSQPHPKKLFAYDWPVLNTKPVDYPFGPYTDGFAEKQHKYGPFADIQKAKKK